MSSGSIERDAFKGRKMHEKERREGGREGGDGEGRRRNSENVRAAVCLLSGINRSLFRRESERCPARVARAALLFECGADIGCRYIAIRPSKYPIDRSLSRVSVTIPRHPYRPSLFLPAFPSGLSSRVFRRRRQFRILVVASSSFSVPSVSRAHRARTALIANGNRNSR